MAVEVRIPTILRKHTGGEKAVAADGDTVRDLLGDLDRRYPGIASQLLTDDGSLHRHHEGRSERVPLPRSGFYVAAIVEDRDGSLWVGGPGLTRLRDGRAEAFAEGDGLASGQVLSSALHAGGLNG